MEKKLQDQGNSTDKTSVDEYKNDKVNYYMNKDNVEVYKSALVDYDGSWLMDKLSKYLVSGKNILELGMGTGLDYD